MARLVRVEIEMLSLILVMGSGQGYLHRERCVGLRLFFQLFTCVYGYVPDGSCRCKSHY